MKALLQVKPSRGKPTPGGPVNRAWLTAPARAKLTVEVVRKRTAVQVPQAPSGDVGVAAAAEPAAAAPAPAFDLTKVFVGPARRGGARPRGACRA